jgi:hypothetical protein
MVALAPQHGKMIAKQAAAHGNRIATYADDVAGHGSNRISQYLNPTITEEAIQAGRQRADKIVNGAVTTAKSETSTLGSYLDKTVGLSGQAMEYAAWAPMYVGAAQMGKNAISWTYNKGAVLTGVKTAEEVASKVPAKKWNAYTFGELGNVTGVGGFLGKAAQKTADLISTPIAYIADKTRLSSWRAGANAAKAANTFSTASELAAALPVEDLQVLGNLRDIVKSAPNVEGFAAAANAKDVVSVAKSALESSEISKAGKQFLTSAEDALFHTESVGMWSNVKGAVQNAPAQASKVSATHGMMNAAFIGMSALSMYGDAKTFSENLASLRQMYADMTGKDAKDVSTISLLTGKVPEPVAVARSHMIKTFGIKQALDVANIAANVALVFGRRGGGWKSIGAMMATSMASSAVDGVMGESILPVHKAFSDAYKAGREIPAEFYASYLYAASKDLNSRGEKGQQFAMQVAHEYASEHASPAQLLQEIENGKLVERIKNIAAKADELAKQHTHAEIADDIVRDTGAQLVQKERPVVGKFTNKLNQEAQLSGANQNLAV